MQEAKKTSNLQILSNAGKYISVSAICYTIPCAKWSKTQYKCIKYFSQHLQALKRKDRDLDHETETLAKEKIAKQQRLTMLRRQFGGRGERINDSTIHDGLHIRARERGMSNEAFNTD